MKIVFVPKFENILYLEEQQQKIIEQYPLVISPYLLQVVFEQPVKMHQKEERLILLG